LVTAAALALTLLATPEFLLATTLEINSGPNIKTELLRSNTPPAITASFSFALPSTAAGDGLFEMFAGGDLNNITDKISVSAGGQSLGALNFPIDPANPIKCEGSHASPAPAGCPVPESVPGGSLFDASRGPAVGDVEGRRDVTSMSFGTAGLIVPKSLLVGGTTLTFSLLADPGVYDLYIDRLNISFAVVPEPGLFALLALGLVALVAFESRARRRQTYTIG